MIRRNNFFTTILILTFGLIFFMSAGCNPTNSTSTPDSVASSPIIEAAATGTASVSENIADPTETSAESDASATGTVMDERTLTLWVPPQFDPAASDDAGKLMSELISQFNEENPHVKVSVRVKALTGDSSALNTLSAAVNAAPEIIPSLIILNRNDLVEAVKKGMIYPISTGLFTDTASWYSYAKESSAVDNLIYSIPIAGDPLVLGYRPSKTGPEVTNWDEILSRGLPIAFEPSSQKDLFGTFIYIAMGGKITNDLGQPWLDQAILTKTLDLFLTGGQKGAFPPSLAQGTSGSDYYQMFLEGSIHMIVTRLTTFEHSKNQDVSVIPLPLFEETDDYPLVNTWNIVLSNINPDVQNLAMKLAEKFVDPAFNDPWTHASGYLPVRTIGNRAWETDEFYESMLQISENAQLIQANQTLDKIVPVINEAISSVIKTVSVPADAAAAAVESLK